MPIDHYLRNFVQPGPIGPLSLADLYAAIDHGAVDAGWQVATEMDAATGEPVWMDLADYTLVTLRRPAPASGASAALAASGAIQPVTVRGLRLSLWDALLLALLFWFTQAIGAILLLILQPRA